MRAKRSKRTAVIGAVVVAVATPVIIVSQTGSAVSSTDAPPAPRPAPTTSYEPKSPYDMQPYDKYYSKQDRRQADRLSRELESAPEGAPATRSFNAPENGNSCDAPATTDAKYCTKVVPVPAERAARIQAEILGEYTSSGFTRGVWLPPPPDRKCINTPRNQGYYSTRLEACSMEVNDLIVFDLRTLIPQGSMPILNVNYMRMNNNGTATMRYWQVHGIGTGKLARRGFMSGYPSFKCSSACIGVPENPSGRITPLTEQPLKFQLTMRPRFHKPNSFARMRAKLTIRFWPTNPADMVLPTASHAPQWNRGDTPIVRCDNKKLGYRRTGCILDNQISVMKMHVENERSRDVAIHVRDSQRILADHWGRFPDGRLLSRTMKASERRRNRAMSCPASIKRPRGKTCDEFPFASTQQGAWFTKGAKPKRWHRKMVRASHNASAGAQLTHFYKRGRISHGDAFWVLVV